MIEYEENEENINKALIELDVLKTKIGNINSSNEQMFTRLSNAIKVLSSKGPIQDKVDDDEFGYYDDSKIPISQYIQGNENDELYNPGQTCTTFLLSHYGNSEQFALVLSMLFLKDKNIFCYPVKIRATIDGELEQKFIYHYLNFVIFVDDDGTYISSCFVDLYQNVNRAENWEELQNILREKYSSSEGQCSDITMLGVAYFEEDIDINKNFTIIQTLTDTAVIEFNYDAFYLDVSNAEFEKCSDITGYLDSKDLAKCLKNYLK